MGGGDAGDGIALIHGHFLLGMLRSSALVEGSLLVPHSFLTVMLIYRVFFTGFSLLIINSKRDVDVQGFFYRFFFVFINFK